MYEAVHRSCGGAGGVVLCVLLASAGCGSKTGLEVPDARRNVTQDAGAPCYEIPPDGGVLEVPIATEARLARADIVFLIDVTQSMGDEIDQIRSQLRDRLAPAIEEAIPDVQLAVATYADFPVDPYGDPTDVPFSLRLPMTDDLSSVQAAVNAIELKNGRDEPESQTEALYQIATGEGYLPYVEASFGCPHAGFGYPCFRLDALPVVLHFTDAPMHNGPNPAHDYTDRLLGGAHGYGATIDQLTSHGIRVIGFDSGEGAGSDDLRAVARATGALDVDRRPLVYDIGNRGQNLGTGVIEAMQQFAQGVVLDIDADVADPDPDDAIDVTRFVEGLVPVRAEPMDGVESIDVEAGVFRRVRAGTRVIFQLRLRNGVVVPGTEPLRLRLEVIFRGDGTPLATQIVEVVIPAADGRGCSG